MDFCDTKIAVKMIFDYSFLFTELCSKTIKSKKPSAIGTVAMYLSIRHTTSSCVFYFSV